MTSTVTSVVKVGGSLFDWTEFPCRMSAFLRTLAADRTAERIILIAGGGPAADVIREIDRIHELGDQTAHRLAFTPWSCLPDLGRARPPSPRPLRRGWPLPAWSAGGIPILAPSLVCAKLKVLDTRCPL